MSLTALTYWVVGSTFALYIGIAIATRASSTRDFYVADGGVHPVANGMATAADWMSAASFISMAGLIALSYNGYGGSVFLMGMDRRLCLAGASDRALPKEVRELYRPRLYWCALLL